MGKGENDSLQSGREIHSSSCQSGKPHNVCQPPSLLSNRIAILRPNLPSFIKVVYDLQAAELAYRTCVHSTTYHFLTVSTIALISSCPTWLLNVGCVLRTIPQSCVPKTFRECALATLFHAEPVEDPFSGSLESTRERRSMRSPNVPHGYFFPTSSRVLVGQGTVAILVRVGGGRRLPVWAVDLRMEKRVQRSWCKHRCDSECLPRLGGGGSCLDCWPKEEVADAYFDLLRK